MLKNDIKQQFFAIVQEVSSSSYCCNSFHDVNVTLKHLSSDTDFEIEMSDARIVGKFKDEAFGLFAAMTLEDVTAIKHFSAIEPILFNGQSQADKISEADALYLYSGFLDITDKAAVHEAVYDIFNIAIIIVSFAQTKFSTDKFTEGGASYEITKRIERSSATRKQAIALHGTNCMVCDINFNDTYGELGENFIHIHHLKPISVAGFGAINAATDLVPVCPNCHAMIHRKSPPLTIETMKKIIKRSVK